jgi:hypothetical protein
MEAKKYDPPLDPGIAHAVHVLNDAAIETFESCEGGPGHAYPEPTVRFHGDFAKGFEALAVALRAGLPVSAIRRTWPINNGEPTGPWWEMTFYERRPKQEQQDATAQVSASDGAQSQ